MNISFYYHSGSFNHGCEALVRSSKFILKNENFFLYSFKKDEDLYVGLNEICEIIDNNPKKKTNFLLWFITRFLYSIKILNFYELTFFNLLKNNNIALAIGGDTYCYKNELKELIYINKKLNQKKIKTVLWGCSVEPNLLDNLEVIEDLKRYSLITARETITYNALIEAGVTKNTKLYPDPAFTLDKIELELPINFIEGKTVGINLSPLIQRLEKIENITYKNYRELVRHIIEQTDNNVALIPHVVWESNNDLELLNQLYSEFVNTGRVVMIEDHNCLELKGFISRCRMFIGARTHATIAAYSSCVPTLVVGYSVKAKGIAKDIFGTYENYVIPVQSLQSESDLINAYKWLEKNEDNMRNHLNEFMPQYKELALKAGSEIIKLIGENE